MPKTKQRFTQEPKDTYEYNIYYDEVEFSKDADQLIEAIRQRRIRLGQEDKAETTLQIATNILKRRLGL